MNLLHELRRRRVFRATGLYIVAAWVVIEGASVLFPAWDIPDTSLRYLVIAAVLGFPIALVFGWTYDITSHGIVRTPKASSGESVDLSLKTADRVILTLLVVAGVSILWTSGNRVLDEASTVAATSELDTKRENSVAVLPFVNLAADSSTNYFSDGVTEEILHRLSTMKALHILSSASSFAFRNSDVGPDRISDILGVRYLLHGSVRRDGNFVRVTSRLTDDKGFQIWSQTFDRELEGIFVIQSEIASAVSSQVAKQIIPMASTPEGRTTEIMDAYDAYLVGKAFNNSRIPGWQAKAIEAFNRAIALDPEYAPPYAGLAVAATVGRSSYESVMPDPEPPARKAIELDPELADGHAALGLSLLAMDDRDLDGSVVALRRALELDPSNSFAYNWLAGALSELGLNAESDAIQDQGLSIDPLNAPLSVNVGNRYLRLGEVERAKQLMLRLTYLPEPPGVAYWELMSLHTSIGQHSEALVWAQEIVKTYYDKGNVHMFAAIAWAYQRMGMTDDGNYWIGHFLERVGNPLQRFASHNYLLRLQGNATGGRESLDELYAIPNIERMTQRGFPAAVLSSTHVQLGEYEKGIEIFEAAFDVETISIIDELGSMAAYEFAHIQAYAYQKVGRDTDAQALLTRLKERTQGLVDEQNMKHGPIFEALALNSALSGDYDLTHDYLSKAVKAGWANYFWLINDEMWVDAVKQPDIARLLDDVLENIEEQREIAQARDAATGFRAEFEALSGT